MWSILPFVEDIIFIIMVDGGPFCAGDGCNQMDRNLS
jgi:hypothetical protein